VTFRTSLTGLSVLLRNAIVIIFSRGVLQPSGIRRFGNGVSQLSPLRPVLGNGDPLIENLRNALTFERVLQRPAPSQLWTTNRSRMRYPASQYSKSGKYVYLRKIYACWKLAPCLETRGWGVNPHPVGYTKEKKLREVNQQEQPK
jgi:hypothetical protein